MANSGQTYKTDPEFAEYKLSIVFFLIPTKKQKIFTCLLWVNNFLHIFSGKMLKILNEIELIYLLSCCCLINICITKLKLLSHRPIKIPRIHLHVWGKYFVLVVVAASQKCLFVCDISCKRKQFFKHFLRYFSKQSYPTPLQLKFAPNTS